MKIYEHLDRHVVATRPEVRIDEVDTRRAQQRRGGERLLERRGGHGLVATRDRVEVAHHAVSLDARPAAAKQVHGDALRHRDQRWRVLHVGDRGHGAAAVPKARRGTGAVLHQVHRLEAVEPHAATAQLFGRSEDGLRVIHHALDHALERSAGVDIRPHERAGRDGCGVSCESSGEAVEARIERGPGGTERIAFLGDERAVRKRHEPVRELEVERERAAKVFGPLGIQRITAARRKPADTPEHDLAGLGDHRRFAGAGRRSDRRFRHDLAIAPEHDRDGFDRRQPGRLFDRTRADPGLDGVERLDRDGGRDGVRGGGSENTGHRCQRADRTPRVAAEQHASDAPEQQPGSPGPSERGSDPSSASARALNRLTGDNQRGARDEPQSAIRHDRGAPPGGHAQHPVLRGAVLIVAASRNHANRT